ncbi:hypothetical protein [Enterococcus durans]
MQITVTLKMNAKTIFFLLENIGQAINQLHNKMLTATKSMEGMNRMI